MPTWKQFVTIQGAWIGRARLSAICRLTANHCDKERRCGSSHQDSHAGKISVGWKGSQTEQIVGAANTIHQPSYIRRNYPSDRN